MKLKKVAAAICVAAGMVSSAMATTVTLNGTHFTATYDDALVGLFGTVSVVGDSIELAPQGSPGFTAQTDVGLKYVNSTITFTVTAKSGYTLSGANVLESGDYFFYSDPDGKSSVSVSGQLRVKPLGGAVLTSSLTTSGLGTANSWFDSATHDWTAAAAVTPLPAAVTAANVTIQNILGAWVSKTADGYALIEKKNVTLGVSVTAVPEPETYAMMLAGLGAIGFLASRRRG